MNQITRTHPEDAASTPTGTASPIGEVLSVDGAKLRGRFPDPSIVEDGERAASIGQVVRIKTPTSRIFGVIGAIGGADADAIPTFEIQLLGEIPDDGGRFQRGVASYPLLGEAIYKADPVDLKQVYARPDAANIKVGRVHPDHSLPAYLITDDLLGKHFAVLGSTGSGKSCSATLVLQAILDEHDNGHVVLLDPHNEYATAFGELADVMHPGNMHLPYWLLNFEEMTEVLIGRDRSDRETQAAILKAAIVHARRVFAGENAESENITVDTPLPYSLGELVKHINDQLGVLDKPENSVPFLRLKSRIESLRSDRRYAFMFAGLVVQDTLGDILSRILSIPVGGKPVTIVDLSGVPSEIVDVVVSVLCRMIFDFALWSVPAKALPVLLVCEEAHRYVPRETSHGFEPTKRVLSRVAMEGRKYGVSLCLVSQRPSELAPNILSQCNTMFALRMSNERDQEIVRRALPENAHGLLSALPSLRTQEAVVVGEGVALPMRLRFDDLADGRRPKSGSANFAERWQQEDQTRQFIDETITRWREQLR